MSRSPLRSRLRSAASRGSPDARLLFAVTTVSLVALVVRLWELGERVFHWDEGRVGYWTLRYAETGEFAYDPIIHGPFLRIVNATVFGMLPPTDATARLVVAVVGGLLPLAAWLFREHLDRVEVVALATLLAANPLLVYYSRFMRNDVLVGAFAFVALGFAVRALDTRRVRYLYPSAAFLALSLSTKANTLLYVLCFAGAAVLVADHRLVRRVRDGDSLTHALRSWASSVRDAARTLSGDRSAVLVLPGHAIGLAATFLAVVVFLYAPRPLLYTALGTPSLWGELVHEATVGSARALVDLWITGDMQDNPYLEYLGHELETLAHGAAVVCVFALVGFVVDGYGRRGDDVDDGRVSNVPSGRSRALVAFASYWALASLVGYPAATDINAPWSAVHVVLPLTIPAAVGVAYVAREAVAAVDRADRRTTIAASAVLLVAVAGVVAPTALYWNSADPDHTEVVQWSQPHNDLRESLDDAESVIATADRDVDVLFVGADIDSRDGSFYIEDETAAETKGAPGGWYDRLPLPWYFERADASVDSVPPDADHAEALADPPPVVVAHADNLSAVDPHLDGYVDREHDLRLWSFRVVVYVDAEALATVERD